MQNKCAESRNRVNRERDYPLSLLFFIWHARGRLQGLDGLPSVILNGTAVRAANITSLLTRKLNYRLGRMETLANTVNVLSPKIFWVKEF